MNYDFVPISTRKPLKWPNGARVALILTINVEYWDLLKDTDKPYYAGGPSILPDPLPGNVPDYPNYTWREYGQRVGVWRMIDVFDRAGVPASVTMNAKAGLKLRQIIDAVNSRSWEIIAHNYVQTDLLSDYFFEPEREHAIIRETLRVYEQVVGRKAKGWLSSSLRCTPKTADFCAEEGLLFFTDLLNDDQPYLVHTPSGPIVSVPYSNEVNDFMLFFRRGMTTTEALDVFKEQLVELHREGAESGRLMSIGLHPHVTGQPFRIRALRDFIEYAKNLDGVWWATREEIASWYLKNHSSHIAPSTITALSE
ncbi:MAG: polysaccharide deacetylase [Deltaproteobacteria bacterium]|nr:polysaccharide deacetylase [Deltaproteobacteria bacterium]